MLPNVKQKTIKPIIEAMVVKGTMIYTDEYSIYARLPVWCCGARRFMRAEGCLGFLIIRRRGRIPGVRGRACG
jgi:hypothetical protein